jgi:hypothetical protein
MVPGDDERILCCREFGEVESTFLRSHEDHALTQEQARELWKLLVDCSYRKPTNWMGSDGGLCFRFRDGIVGCFSATEKDNLVYHDNTRAEYWRLTVQNKALHRAVRKLFDNLERRSDPGAQHAP